MDEDGTGTRIQALLDEVADFGELGQQVLRHTVFTSSEEVIAFRNDLLVPGLAPMHPSHPTERDHAGDVLLDEDFAITRTLAVAKVESVGDLGDWRIRHADSALDYGDGVNRPGDEAAK